MALNVTKYMAGLNVVAKICQTRDNHCHIEDQDKAPLYLAELEKESNSYAVVLNSLAVYLDQIGVCSAMALEPANGKLRLTYTSNKSKQAPPQFLVGICNVSNVEMTVRDAAQCILDSVELTQRQRDFVEMVADRHINTDSGEDTRTLDSVSEMLLDAILTYSTLNATNELLKGDFCELYVEIVSLCRATLRLGLETSEQVFNTIGYEMAVNTEHVRKCVSAQRTMKGISRHLETLHEKSASQNSREHTSKYRRHKELSEDCCPVLQHAMNLNKELSITGMRKVRDLLVGEIESHQNFVNLDLLKGLINDVAAAVKKLQYPEFEVCYVDTDNPVHCEIKLFQHFQAKFNTDLFKNWPLCIARFGVSKPCCLSCTFWMFKKNSLDLFSCTCNEVFPKWCFPDSKLSLRASYTLPSLVSEASVYPTIKVMA